MKKEEISRRIEEVMRTDATVATEADFMLTHMPFNRLAYYKEIYRGQIQGNEFQHNLLRENEYEDAPRFSEQSVLEDLISDGEQHKLFMIIGRNGSGKSHLIRWLYYQFKKHYVDLGDESEKTIFIPRAHNNLKEALKTILDAGVLSADRVQYYLNRIGGGSSNASEEELKDLIFANLEIIVKHDEKESELDVSERRKLKDFIADEAVENCYFRTEKGPINQIYNALTKNLMDISNGDPFQESMFVMNVRDIQTNLRNANHQAKPDVMKFAGELSKNSKLRSSVVKYFNSLVNMVIERTSSISGADVHSIFEEMRKELKESGKCLTLFIEDINVYKGIDSALIEVLIQEHTDTNGLCRIKSVVGSTDRYFDDYFNNALRDRMTKKIVILEKTLLEDKQKLIEFAARYINAIHFKKENVADWYYNGAEFPVWENNHKFSKVIVDGKEFSIFPFNENAIINLFECLNESARSPRGFLKCVVKTVVSLWNNYEEHMIDSKHHLLSNEGISRINGFLTQTDKDAFDVKKYVDSDRRELLYQIWGNRTFEKDENGDLAGVPEEVLSIFKVDKDGSVEILDKVVKSPSGDSSEKKKDVSTTELKTIKQKDTVFETQIKEVLDWQDGIKKEFVAHKDAREVVSKFILKNINWELEDIPYTYAQAYITKLSNYEIEGQTVPSTGKIKLERNKSTGKMLVALFRQNNQKNSKSAWNYEQGPEDEIFAKTWLLQNKKRIISIVKEEVMCGECLEQLAVEARIASLVSSGLIQTWETEKMIDTVVRANILLDSKPVHNSIEKWNSLGKYFEDNAVTIKKGFDLMYLNTVGMTKADSGNVKYIIIDTLDLIQKIEKAKKSISSGKCRAEINSFDDRINVLSDSTRFYQNSISDCMTEMTSIAGKYRKQLNEWLGEKVVEAHVRKTIEKMSDYLSFIKKDIGHNYPPKMIEVLEENHSAAELVKFVNELKLIVSVKDNFELSILCGNFESQKLANMMKAFSEFEKFMKEKSKLFSSKVDSSLDKKITNIENEIRARINDCLAKG